MDEPEDDAPSRRLRGTARRLDSDPRLLGLASWLRRRVPGDERFGDPLSTAGATPAQLVGRKVSGLQPDRPSATHELSLGALQVWQSLSEASGRGRGDDPVAILFTDLVKFSAWALKAGDEATLDLLREVGVVVEREIAQHRGRIVKRLGDGVMATFLEPEQAVTAAQRAQAGLAGVEIAGYRPRMRAGVHVGRPRQLGGDLLGVDVNIAARVGAAAGADEILLSETAYMRLDPARVEAGRARTLRAAGAPKGLRVRTVRMRTPPAPEA